MADTQRISHIPVMSPRATQPKFPSTASSPHLGLVPPSRYPSVSGSPTIATPTSSPSSPSSSGSTPFRTFRNFLSFGGGGSKQANSNAGPSAIPKSHFSTLGPIRRSVNVERRASSPQINAHARRSEDEYVLKIDLPRPGDEGLFDIRLPRSSDPPMMSTSTLQSAQSSNSHSPVADSPGASLLHTNPSPTHVTSCRIHLSDSGTSRD